MAGAIRNIILTADDFGACDYIDNGIYKAIENGVVTCVSAFINFKRRKENEPGGKYVGSIAALKKLRKKHPNIPIGLHLTINTGTPVAPAHTVNALVQNSVNSGVPYFNTIEKFSTKVYFTPHIVKQIGVEVRAQLDAFTKALGRPNHISCHFGILFHFQNFLDEILASKGISGIPVRNPVMVFQTPNKEKGEKENELKNAKEFYRRRSNMRVEGVEKAKKWADSFEAAIALIVNGINKKKRLETLMKSKCFFPDYTLGALYKRKKDDWEGGLALYLGKIPTFVPKFYAKKNHGKSAPVSEFICHLGHGPIPATSPVGVNHKYFKGRALEVDRLIAAKPLFQNSAINLVDYSFLTGRA